MAVRKAYGVGRRVAAAKGTSGKRNGEVAEHVVLDENKDARSNILVVDNDHPVLATPEGLRLAGYRVMAATSSDDPLLIDAEFFGTWQGGSNHGR